MISVITSQMVEVFVAVREEHSAELTDVVGGSALGLDGVSLVAVEGPVVRVMAADVGGHGDTLTVRRSTLSTLVGLGHCIHTTTHTAINIMVILMIEIPIQINLDETLSN